MLISIGFCEVVATLYIYIVLRCRWFRTKAASACPLLETIDRVYPWRFTG